jgi:hypothetical protein
MKFILFQLNMERASSHHGCRVYHWTYKNMKRDTGRESPDAADYDLVYAADMPEIANLEQLFQELNVRQPENYHCASMSVSDVIEVVGQATEEPGFYFCDSFGFVRITFERKLTRNVFLDQVGTMVPATETEKAKVSPDYTEEGMCYKSEEAFLFNPVNGICYISEGELRNECVYDAQSRTYSLPEDDDAPIVGYTANDFLEMCNGNYERAYDCFRAVNWQSPETLLDVVDEEKDV